jgi:hypothetical protein
MRMIESVMEIIPSYNEANRNVIIVSDLEESNVERLLSLEVNRPVGCKLAVLTAPEWKQAAG